MRTRRWPRALLLTWAAAACSAGSAAREHASTNSPPGAAAETTYRYAAPPDLDDGWRVAPADALGIDVALLEALTNAIRQQEYANIHAVLIERDGHLVYEEYFAGTDVRGRAGQRATAPIVFHRDSLHDLRSVTKSVVSALVGIALERGAIDSVNDPLLTFFPDHAYLATPEKRRITLRHALTMSAGLEWNELDVPYTDPHNDEIGMSRSGDPVGYVLERPLADEPGTRWNYSGGLTQLLASVLERATGQSLVIYARRTLFQPLDIGEFSWDSRGAASGLRLRARDLAKFGSLYLSDGRWNERQVVPASWITASISRHVAVKDSVSDHGQHGYGYQWWHDRYRTEAGEIEVHTAIGNGGQRIFVIPGLRMVVTVFSGRYDDPTSGWLPEQILLRYIVPASTGDTQRGTGDMS